MTDVFLGVIAFAVVVMAVIQVAAIIFAVGAAKRVGEAASRIEHELRPIVRNLETITADAARASGLSLAQLERVDRLFADLGRRLDQVLGALPGFLGPASKGAAVFGAARAIFAAFREFRGPRRSRKRSAQADDEDALFIG